MKTIIERLRILALPMLLSHLPECVEAQRIAHIMLEQKGDMLEIHFDLDAPATSTYTVIPFIIRRNGERIRPVSMMRSNELVTTGKDRVIRWDVLHDLPALEGEVSAELMLVETGKTSAYTSVHNGAGGPGNAFLSMLLPGLGDVFVNSTGEKVKIKPSWIMAGYLSSVALALYSYHESKQYYEAYLATPVQYEMNDYYDKAVYHRKHAQFFGFAAAAIWVTDVVHVLVKGAGNMRHSSSIAAGGLSISGSLVYNQPALALKYRF